MKFPNQVPVPCFQCLDVGTPCTGYAYWHLAICEISLEVAAHMVCPKCGTKWVKSCPLGCTVHGLTRQARRHLKWRRFVRTFVRMLVKTRQYVPRVPSVGPYR